jgi:hypothetical protein
MGLPARKAELRAKLHQCGGEPLEILGVASGGYVYVFRRERVALGYSCKGPDHDELDLVSPENGECIEEAH